jgi:hypothetical protein
MANDAMRSYPVRHPTAARDRTDNTACLCRTLSLAVAIFDAVKNHNEGKDLLD